MTSISVVIGTRNQRAILKAVLESYARQTLRPDRFELLVADSASTDGTADLCAGQAWPYPLRHLALGHGGKAAARNAALRLATGDLVLLSDADVIADPGLLACHIAAHERRPDLVVVGRQIMIDRIDEVGQEGRDALPGRRRPGTPLSWRELVTGNASLPRARLIEAGGFDERFVGYGYEDYELGHRLAARGLPIVYEPNAVNWHCHPVRFEDDLGRKREAGQAAVLFARLHPSAALRVELGLHPLNRACWGLLGGMDRAHRAATAHAGSAGWRGRLARHFLLEAAYQQGVRDAQDS